MYLPKVSIIIPIYNAENYLKRCLDSILSQTYHNLEILLIDNGSSDGSVKVCKKYVEIDNRCKLLIENKIGVSRARNLGLQNYTGDYCMFVDADDFVAEGYVEILLKIIMRYNVPIAYCKACNCKEKHIPHELTYNEIKPIKINIKENYSFVSDYAHFVVWGVIYTRKIIENLYFNDELFVGEDTVFFAMALKRCSEIVFLNQELYYYVQYDISLSHGKYDQKKHTEIDAWKKVCKIFNNYPIYFKVNCKAALGIRCKKNLYILTKHKQIKYLYWNELIIMMRKNIGNVLLSTLTLKSKMAYIGACIAPDLYFFIIAFLKLQENIK